MNKELHNETMEACLNTECPISDVDVAIEYLTNSLKKAAQMAVPKAVRKPRQAPYNPNIAKLGKISRTAFKFMDVQ